MPLENAISKLHAKFLEEFRRQKPLENADGKCHLKCHWETPLQNTITIENCHWKIPFENAIGKRH